MTTLRLAESGGGHNGIRAVARNAMSSFRKGKYQDVGYICTNYRVDLNSFCADKHVAVASLTLIARESRLLHHSSQR